MKNKACVFVTGADGMLGSSICRELINQDYSVKAFVLPNRKINVLDELEIDIVYGNILDKSLLEAAMVDCDYVINVAALTFVWPRKSEIVMKVNLEGAMNVMEVSEKLGIKKMIQIGTANSFNHGSKNNPGSENNPFDGWRFKMDYITSKYLAQQKLIEHYNKTGFPIVIINPTYMIGPYDSGPSSGKMILEVIQGKIPAYASGGKNFVYSRDVAVAAVNALALGKIGECYIAGNENLSFGDFFKKVVKTRNKPFKLLKAPTAVIIFIGLINSIVARLVKKSPKLSYSMAKMAGMNQYYSAAKAQNELNMPQTPIEVAIDECLTWYEVNGYLKKEK